VTALTSAFLRRPPRFFQRRLVGLTAPHLAAQGYGCLSTILHPTMLFAAHANRKGNFAQWLPGTSCSGEVSPKVPACKHSSKQWILQVDMLLPLPLDLYLRHLKQKREITAGI